MTAQQSLFDEAPAPLDYRVPEAWRQVVRVGTCSWKYPSWAGLVYEAGREYAPDEYLADYARHFDTVEVDQWFWSLFPSGVRLPDADTVRQYAESVPDDFLFSVKAPNAITLTHYYSKQPPRFRDWKNRPNPHFFDVGLVERFLETLEPMRSRLGPVILQFEYLNRRKMPSVEAFCDALDAFLARLPREVPWAVETRNPNFLKAPLQEVLATHGVGTVVLDGYHMPKTRRVLDRFDVFTAEFVVLRLHGPDRPGIERATGKRWDRIVAPRDEGLDGAVELVRRAAERGARVIVNVNNHYEGSAPRTIARLLERLRAETPPAHLG